MSTWKQPLTIERAQRLLRYDPESGNLYWRVSRRCVSAGAVVGHEITSGCNRYLTTKIDGREYRVHRVIWLIVYGQWPAGQIDHKDGNGLNNRLDNLRDVTQQNNLLNQRRPKHNTSGFTGIYWCRDKRRWRARIRHSKRTISLGYFDDIGDAYKARKAAEKRLGFYENHGEPRAE